jgi:hypothetical protein
MKKTRIELSICISLQETNNSGNEKNRANEKKIFSSFRKYMQEICSHISKSPKTST